MTFRDVSAMLNREQQIELINHSDNSVIDEFKLNDTYNYLYDDYKVLQINAYDSDVFTIEVVTK